MKNLTIPALTIGILAASITTAAPAVADTAKVGICHATSASNGHYNLIEVAKDATANGHADHQDGRDIIPAYSWVDKGVRYYFDGQNLDKLDILADGCKLPADLVVAAPSKPVYVPASCSRPEEPFGRVVIPNDLGAGVAGASSALSPDNGTFSVAYALTEPTDAAVYSWPAGVTGTWEFVAVPLTADPLYVTDSRTGAGQCELSATGAGELPLMLAGGVLLGGLALVVGSKIRRRVAS